MYQAPHMEHKKYIEKSKLKILKNKTLILFKFFNIYINIENPK